jgi:catechol 2,3-dioxygenase-like lactoylglutathione lyase family enzyme
MLGEARVEATIAVANLKEARAFYEGLLGLRAAASHKEGVDVTYECGGGTSLFLYEHPGFAAPAHTVAHLIVDDVPATVRALQARGVVFDEYDLPELGMVEGVARVGDHRYAWFKDQDRNVIGLHD